jgi:hypothetical protein
METRWWELDDKAHKRTVWINPLAVFQVARSGARVQVMAASGQTCEFSAEVWDARQHRNKLPKGADLECKAEH